MNKFRAQILAVSAALLASALLAAWLIGGDTVTAVIFAAMGSGALGAALRPGHAGKARAELGAARASRVSARAPHPALAGYRAKALANLMRGGLSEADAVRVLRS